MYRRCMLVQTSYRPVGQGQQRNKGQCLDPWAWGRLCNPDVVKPGVDLILGNVVQLSEKKCRNAFLEHAGHSSNLVAEYLFYIIYILFFVLNNLSHTFQFLWYSECCCRLRYGWTGTQNLPWCDFCAVVWVFQCLLVGPNTKLKLRQSEFSFLFLFFFILM